MFVNKLLIKTMVVNRLFMAKKRWINQNSAELLLKRDSPDEAEIYWSSSSDSEHLLDFITRKQSEVNLKAQKEKTITKHKRKKQKCKYEDINAWHNEHVSEINISPSSNQHSFCESPILAPLQLEELSPVLTRKKQEISQSPILGNSGIKLKTRLQGKRKINFNKQSSVLSDHKECFQSQSSAVIIENDSPTKLDVTFSYVDECELKNTQSNWKEEINVSESDSSNYLISSVSSNNQNKISCKSLSSEVANKRKKKPKKNGWSEKLQKALSKQKSNMDIWQHELFLKKSRNYDVSLSGDPSLTLKVESSWTEYEVVLVKGHILNDNNNLLPNNSSVNIRCNKRCIVLLGFNVNKKLEIYNDGMLQIFSPFNHKYIVGNHNESIIYLFNVYKVLSLNE